MITIKRDELVRVVVAIDPAGSTSEDADDTGIVVVGRGPHQAETCEIPSCPGHGYVLADRTCHLPPHGWASEAIAAFDEWEADRIVAERNFGADMVGHTVHSVRAGLPYGDVRASWGKLPRAEPASALWEQGRCHMLGMFPELENELETWTPEANWSPNRLDALVWGLTELRLINSAGELLTAKGEVPRHTVSLEERERETRAVANLPPHLRRLHRRAAS